MKKVEVQFNELKLIHYEDEEGIIHGLFESYTKYGKIIQRGYMDKNVFVGLWKWKSKSSTHKYFL